MLTRTMVFSGGRLTLQELRDFAMMSCADLDGDSPVDISQKPGGMNGGIASTEIQVHE